MELRDKIASKIRYGFTVKEIVDSLEDLFIDSAKEAFEAGEKNVDYATNFDNGEWEVQKSYKTNSREYIKEKFKVD